MAKISLRVYNREIEGMIEGGQLDEAIAHCQHILKTYSMHIETYRLLGKAFLEGRRYTDATDIFQRVLTAVPDDFVSHVGMSIIRDDEAKLDDAIWHMERAFEVQPSNAAIQNELRRLYGRRDGVEPLKIRLSRDALANMYAQGDLFVQAIAEIRAVLADDPNRPDLQVMLARAYFRAGQKVEAADVAAQLLKKSPYCMDALQILVEVLPGTARAENTQVYRQRLRLLDPYSSFVSGSVFNSDQAADTTVSLERLEYQPGKQAAPSQPTWAASLGVKLEDEKPAKEQPAWLTGSEDKSSPELILSAPGSESSQKQEDEPIPDFLRSAGWGEASEQPAEETQNALNEEPPADQIEKGIMPDWLKSMAPPELSGEEEKQESSTPVEGSDFPNWLTDLGANAGAAAIVTGAAEQAFEEKPVEPVLPGQPTGFETEAVPDEQAESFSEPESEAKAVDSSEPRPLGIEDDTMAWLESLATKQGAKPEELLTKPEDRSDKLPDWLKDFPEENLPQEEQPSKPEPFLGTETEAQAQAHDELSQQPITPTELPSELEERSTDYPDWLKDIQEEKPPQGVELSSSETPLETDIESPILTEPGRQPSVTQILPEDKGEFITEDESRAETPFQPIPGSEAAKPVGIEDDTMAWLEGLAVKQGAKQEDLLTKPEDRSDMMPEWLRNIGEEAGEVAEEKAEPKLEMPAELPQNLAFESEMHQPETPAEATVQAGGEQPVPAEEDVSAWLKNLGESEGDPEIPAAVPSQEPPPTSEEGFPDWLKDLEKQSAQPAEAGEQQPAFPASDLPEWLRQPVESLPEQPVSQVPAEEPEEVSAWAPVDAAPVGLTPPTGSDEWIPVETPGDEPIQAAEPASQVEEFTTSVPQPAQTILSKAPGSLSPIPAQEKDALLLSSAQGELDDNQLNGAMADYAKLIKKNRLLDEVIHDLREALYRFPVDSIVWQTLGDAYMRAGRLQDALDAYTKAEELLR